MPETTPLIKAALNLRVGAGFDVYLITREDAECLYKLQIEAFMPLYEKYQDDATSPAKESLETITKKIVDDNSNFYFV